MDNSLYETKWHKRQAFFRLMLIIFDLFIICQLWDENRWLNFSYKYMEDEYLTSAKTKLNLYINNFADYYDYVSAHMERGIIIMLIAIIIVFILALYWISKRNKIGYKLYNLGLILQIAVGLIYPIIIMVVTRAIVTISIGLVLHIIILAVLILLLIKNKIFYKEHIHEMEQNSPKTTKKIYIVIVSVLLASVIYPTVMIADDFKLFCNYNAMYNNQRKGLSTEIEEQMGNHCQGNGVAVGDKIYLYQCNGFDDNNDGEFNYRMSIYEINESGEYKELYSTELEDSITPQIYYYNDYLYFNTYLYEEASKNAWVMRYSLLDGDVEMFCDTDGYIGIAEGKLYYDNKIAGKNTEREILCVNLDDSTSQAESVLYDAGIDRTELVNRIWISRVLYNQKKYMDESNIYIGFRDYIQYYQDYIYGYSKIELDTNTIEDDIWGLRGYSATDTIHIDNDVSCFNIYKDRVYYVKKSLDGISVWSTDMIGDDRKHIADIQLDETQVDYDFINLIVGDKYLVITSAIETDYYETFIIKDRYIVDIEDGLVKQVEGK